MTQAHQLMSECPLSAFCISIFCFKNSHLHETASHSSSVYSLAIMISIAISGTLYLQLQPRLSRLQTIFHLVCPLGCPKRIYWNWTKVNIVFLKLNSLSLLSKLNFFRGWGVGSVSLNGTTTTSLCKSSHAKSCQVKSSQLDLDTCFSLSMYPILHLVLLALPLKLLFTSATIYPSPHH
jgi:hypothetical protein